MCVETPEYSSDCSVFDGLLVSCENESDCSYDQANNTCGSSPTYVDNCNVFDDYKDACDL